MSPVTTGETWNMPGRTARCSPEAGMARSPVFHVHATFSVFTLSRLMSSSGE
ncbi:MAG: hypothetical protein IPF98_08215 [Gemmatimonadetes bacterium]|nr:hypothetical protein [Gemmatimonadota bacterium]